MKINLTYQAADAQEFRELYTWINEREKEAVVKVAVVTPNTRGPNERAYLEATGKERFRLSEEEAASGMDKEQIAFLRLQALGDTPLPASTSPMAQVQLPKDDGEEI